MWKMVNKIVSSTGKLSRQMEDFAYLYISKN